MAMVSVTCNTSRSPAVAARLDAHDACGLPSTVPVLRQGGRPDMATDVHIGGRLETVAPRRVTDTADRVRLLILVSVAIAVHGWVLTHTKVTARDSIGFARIALQFENPTAAGLTDVVEVLKHSQHPPGYPL